MSAPTNAELKDKQQQAWTLVAPGWRKHDIPNSEANVPVTNHMLERADIHTGAHVLDIASGTGEPAITAARRVGPTGKVIGTDFVAEMLAFAREKAGREGLKQIEFRVVDGEVLEFPDGSFDAVTIRYGLMFMPDPVGCLKGVHRVLKPGGRAAVAVWGAPEKNPWAAVPAAIIRKRLNIPPPPPGTPGLFALADEKRLRSLFEAAGFHDITIEPVNVTMVDSPNGREFFEYTTELSGPLATLMNQLSPADREEVIAEVAHAVEGPGGRATLPGLALVASATR
jgi:ubiquinone/menaquinone biosynthesis C-methylase UbiE